MPQNGRKSRPTEAAPQGAGLKMAAHPLLLDTAPAQPQSKKDKYKPMQPKFASIKVSDYATLPSIWLIIVLSFLGKRP